QVSPERALDGFALTFPQQPRVDQDAGQLVADRAVHEGGRDGRVHAAGESADHGAVADLRAYALDRLVDEGAGRPVGRAAADAEQEVGDDLVAARRVRDLGVELHAE